MYKYICLYTIFLWRFNRPYQKFYSDEFGCGATLPFILPRSMKRTEKKQPA